MLGRSRAGIWPVDEEIQENRFNYIASISHVKNWPVKQQMTEFNQ